MIYSRAVDLAAHIRARRVSPLELVQTVLDRIAAIDGELNAFCTVSPELALEAARAAERAVMRRQPLGPLHGLPIAIKDLIPTAGIRTTLGSTIFADHVPKEDALVVERLKAAGAIVVGKTNTPEFAAGGHTFNLVCGTTRNPWARDLTSGGSSGGSAVALAAGMVPIAEGSDLGGSLRIPAAFCGVVGFRTSPGLVPFYPTKLAWDSLAVEGPMARTVVDAALMLGAMVGLDPRIPISYRPDSTEYLSAARAPSVRGLKIAWSPNLGLCPIDPAVRTVVEKAVRRLERLGARVEEAHPDLSGVEDVIRASRGLRMVALLAPHLAEWRPSLNGDLVRDIENGLKLSIEDVAKAETLRTQLWEHMRTFMSQYDLLITPTVPIKPFPVEFAYPKEINGQPMDLYFSWLVLTYAISIVGLPAISVPAGLTEDGLPVGAQLVGQWRGEMALLRSAAAFESEGEWIAPPRFEHKESRVTAHTDLWPGSAKAEGARKPREALTARQVEHLHKTGERRLALKANEFLTPLARERARTLGVEIVAVESCVEKPDSGPVGKLCCKTAPLSTLNPSPRIYDRQRAFDGVTLVPASAGDASVLLIDMVGTVVHSWRLPYPLAGGAYLDGHSLVFNGRRPEGNQSISAWEDAQTFGAGALVKTTWDGRIVAETRFPDHHHDGIELGNGNVVLLCVERLSVSGKSAPQATTAPKEGDAWADWLAEFTPDGNLVWEWHACEHLTSLNAGGSSRYWTGATSFTHLPSGEIAIAFRNTGEVLVIEREGARVVHRISAPVVNKPHHVSAGTKGNLLVVDDGPTGSRVIDIDPATGNVAWEFRDKNSVSALMAAQRLPNGNTLISERGCSRAFEVTEKGEVVWEFGERIAPSSTSSAALTAQAFRYEKSMIPSLLAASSKAKHKSLHGQADMRSERFFNRKENS